MFLGEFEQIIDDTGCVEIPARFRDESSGGLVLTRGFDRCLQVFKRSTWDRLVRRLNELSIGNADVRNLRRLVLSGAIEVDVNTEGKISIPRNLRTYAELGERVAIAGLDTYFEVWSDERWQHVQQALVDQGSLIAQRIEPLNG